MRKTINFDKIGCSNVIIKMFGVVFVSLIVGGSGYNVLGVFTVPAESHHVINNRIMTELANRNHNVTVYTIFPAGKTTKNYREIDIRSCVGKKPRFENLEEMRKLTLFEHLSVAYRIIPKADEMRRCEWLVNLVKMKSRSEFDALVIEPFDSEVLTGLGYKLEVPVIYVFPNVLYPWLYERLGMPMNPAYMAVFPFLEADVHKTLLSRAVNVVLYAASMTVFKLYLRRTSDREIKLFFGRDTPGIEQMAVNVSLVLSNTHFTVNPSSPVSPNVIQIGGVNVDDAEPLPEVGRLSNSFSCLFMMTRGAK